VDLESRKEVASFSFKVSISSVPFHPDGHSLAISDYERRQEEKTDVFKERYAKRSGIESTNSGMKRRLGLGKLRVRGRKAVFHAIHLKVAGWNLLRAVASGRLAGTGKARGGPARWFWRLWSAGRTRIGVTNWNRSNEQRFCIPTAGIH